jgi:ribosome-binding ATPase YchF (GTP1/OBG family)
MKPILYVANVGEADLPEGSNRWTDALAAAIAEEGGEELVPVCSAIEAELAELDDGERQEFLAELGVEERGLDRFVHGAYHLLGLITFFSTGDKETRAWTIRRGTRAPQAAGTIHTDFERGFIRAETISWDTFVHAGSMKSARDQGLVRSEGKDYVVQDGDVLLFRFNV